MRKLAAAKLAGERPGQTLDATALVHEAYLRLVGDQAFDGRGHFFAAAAEAMRRILVEQARRRKAVKHGGVLAVWSAGPDQPFAGRMRRAGFAVEEVQVRASPSGKGARHIIWVGVAR